MAKSPYHKTAPRKQNVFDEILKTGIGSGYIPGKTDQARKWYRRMASKAIVPSSGELLSSDPGRFRQTVEVGRMYMFLYNPKTKADLPYYDKFPLVFPFAWYDNSFLGLNLHYLPPTYRAKLMDALYNLSTSNNDSKTKLRLSYAILKNASELSFFRPCVKKYLKSFVMSRFVAVGAEEWDIALFLPTESFEKAPKTKVWADSKAIIARKKPFGVGRGRLFNPYKR